MNYIKMTNELAKKGKDNVKGNPMVGCVIVKDDKVISAGYHEYYGGNHAERNAILNSKENVEGSTLYVNLEPCNHYGKTPPCTDLIIQSKIKKVFIGARDSSDKVNGTGTKKLVDHNIEVQLMDDEESIILNYEFLKKTYKSVRTTIKVATSMDGKIATKSYDSKGISSKEALNETQKLRGEYDAIIVGSNTVKQDNPNLTYRLDSDKQIQRVVIDYKLDTAIESKVYNSLTNGHVVIFTSMDVDYDKVIKFRSLGHKVFNVLTSYNDLLKVKEYLYFLGVKSVLIEGGGSINESFLQQNLVDTIRFHISPKIIGGKNSISAFHGHGVNKIKESYRLKNINLKLLGEDILIEGDVDVHRNN